jgi:hypothetical protein
VHLRYRTPPCCLPGGVTPSASRISVFGAQYPACIYPCPTLQVQPHDCPRMARGQDGSLRLSCMALTFTAPRRFIPTLSAPQRVLAAHPANQLACFDRHARTTATAMTGLPRPEETEASSVPTDDRLGFHDNQRGTPVPPSYRQPCPQEPVRRGQLRSFHRPLHNGELMAQSQHLQLKVCTAAKTIPQRLTNGR